LPATIWIYPIWDLTRYPSIRGGMVAMVEPHGEIGSEIHRRTLV